jgi:hypothetical protein
VRPIWPLKGCSARGRTSCDRAVVGANATTSARPNTLKRLASLVVGHELRAYATSLRAFPGELAGGTAELAGTSTTTTVSVLAAGPLTPGVTYEFWLVGHNFRGDGTECNHLTPPAKGATRRLRFFPQRLDHVAAAPLFRFDAFAK